MIDDPEFLGFTVVDDGPQFEYYATTKLMSDGKPEVFYLSRQKGSVTCSLDYQDRYRNPFMKRIKEEIQQFYDDFENSVKTNLDRNNVILAIATLMNKFHLKTYIKEQFIEGLATLAELCFLYKEESIYTIQLREVLYRLVTDGYIYYGPRR